MILEDVEDVDTSAPAPRVIYLVERTTDEEEDATEVDVEAKEEVVMATKIGRGVLVDVAVLGDEEVEVIDEEEEVRTGRMRDPAPELNMRVAGGLAVTVAFATDVEEEVVIGISTPTNPIILLFAF